MYHKNFMPKGEKIDHAPDPKQVLESNIYLHGMCPLDLIIKWPDLVKECFDAMEEQIKKRNEDGILKRPACDSIIGELFSKESNDHNCTVKNLEDWGLLRKEAELPIDFTLTTPLERILNSHTLKRGSVGIILKFLYRHAENYGVNLVNKQTLNNLLPQFMAYEPTFEYLFSTQLLNFHPQFLKFTMPTSEYYKIFDQSSNYCFKSNFCDNPKQQLTSYVYKLEQENQMHMTMTKHQSYNSITNYLKESKIINLKTVSD